MRALVSRLLGVLLVTSLLPANAQEYRSETVAAPPSARVDATAVRTSVSTEDARRGNSDTAQLIQREPDVRVRRSGGMNGPSYIAIRGSEPESVRYTLEGVPLHGAGVTIFDINTILPELLGRIDIYRTTVPVQFGNVSSGGVVDFQLRDSRRREVFATAGFGSFGSWKASAAGSVPLDDGHFRIAASVRGTQGNFRFYNTNGTDFNTNDDRPNELRVNNDALHGGLMLIRDHRIDQWRFRLLSITDVWEGGVSGIDVAQSQHARQRRLHQNLTFSATGNLGERRPTELKLVSSLQVRRLDFTDRHGEIGLGSQDRTDHQTLGIISVITQTRLKETLTLRTLVDLQVEHDRPSDKIYPLYVYSSRRTYPALGVELMWKHPKEWVSLSVGGRASVYHQATDAADVPAAPEYKRTDTAVSPQLGLVFQPVDDELHRLQFALYGSRSHRQPGFDELFGDSGGVVGNSELTAERQYALELVGNWQFRPGAWHLDLRFQSWFHWRENAIEYFALPAGVRKPVNIKGARVRGQELSFVAHHDVMTLSAQFGHLFSENLSDDTSAYGKLLPWRSPWTATVGARIRPLPQHLGHRLELIGNFRYDAEFYADARNRRRYPSRAETDLGVEFDPRWRNVPSLRIEAFNVFNRRVTTVPGRNGGRDVELIRPVSDFNGYPRPGRSVYATLTWELDR